jgi:hypothetical protein
VETEDDAKYLYLRAQNCVDGECPLDEARDLLHQMLLIQSLCDSGRTSGMCKDQDVAIEIVANLRVKVSGSDLANTVERQQIKANE